MENKDVLIGAIRACKTRESLDDTLSRYNVENPQQAIDFLNESMYSPETFFSSNAVTVEEKLEFTKQVFLTGTWRLNEYYDQMRIGSPGNNASADRSGGARA